MHEDDNHELRGRAYCSIARWMRFSGMSHTAVMQNMARGNLPAIKVDRATLIDVERACQWLAKQPRWQPGAALAARVAKPKPQAKSY